jgi:hypothetical protein
MLMYIDDVNSDDPFFEFHYIHGDKALGCKECRNR